VKIVELANHLVNYQHVFTPTHSHRANALQQQVVRLKSRQTHTHTHTHTRFAQVQKTPKGLEGQRCSQCWIFLLCLLDSKVIRTLLLLPKLISLCRQLHGQLLATIQRSRRRNRLFADGLVCSFAVLSNTRGQGPTQTLAIGALAHRGNTLACHGHTDARAKIHRA
jgi:hypothetical protein